MKATALAPSNIAFVKYWGRKDERLRLPENSSISMNLSELKTTTTVEFSDIYERDSVVISGVEDQKETERAVVHLDRIRKIAGVKLFAKVVSENSFPSSRGLSSSASGFAALTVAGANALGLSLSEKELSILARQGSGSACRSIPSGFVQWLDGDTSDTSYAISLFPQTYWRLCDVVVVTGLGKKEIPTSEGMKLTETSPFFSQRLSGISSKLSLVQQALQDKDFEKLGLLAEKEALEMHAIMISSQPPLLYWTEKTLSLMKKVLQWRKSGTQVYFTLNTGQDMHLLCEPDTLPTVLEYLKQEDGIVDVLVNYPSEGTHCIDTHLF